MFSTYEQHDGTTLTPDEEGVMRLETPAAVEPGDYTVVVVQASDDREFPASWRFVVTVTDTPRLDDEVLEDVRSQFDWAVPSDAS